MEFYNDLYQYSYKLAKRIKKYILKNKGIKKKY